MATTRRKAKPGQVLFFYGRIPHEGEDHVTMWGGEGATKRHSNNVMHGFTQPKLWPYSERSTAKSFLDELDAAGFDIKTIQFCISVKKDHP
jgi:hypothetical protein